MISHSCIIWWHSSACNCMSLSFLEKSSSCSIAVRRKAKALARNSHAKTSWKGTLFGPASTHACVCA